MEIEEFKKLEEKVGNMVKRMHMLKDENGKMKVEIDKLKKNSSVNETEKSEIRKRVTALIQMIDSIEAGGAGSP
ncbi:MAG: hypothetical protein KAW12_25710 [Candidatus Aminicenantes bacterium]|nr:hypothetical protein [Candidatus Aminicenantes bacterium]